MCWRYLTPALVAASASFALAQEETAPATPPSEAVPLFSLEETVIRTASLKDESWLETPYTVDVISQNIIQERAVRSLPEALEETPGVFVQKTSHGQGSPYIRGLTGYHNLLLIDGVRLNNAAFRSGPNEYWNTVDPYGLERIELVKSQGSVLYGSDAVGGTLQAFTSRPYYAEQGTHVGGRSYTRLASGERSFIQRGEASLSEAGRYGLIIGGTFKEFGDIQAAGLGRLPHTGYDEWNGDAKLELFLNENTRLTLFHQQTHMNDAWRTHSTIYNKSWRGAAVGSELARVIDQDRYLSYIQLDGLADSALFDHYTLTLSHHLHEENQYRLRTGDRIDYQGFELNSYGANAIFNKDLEITELTYGASYYQDVADSFRTNYVGSTFRGSDAQGPIGDDSVYHLASAFVNTRTPIGERLAVDIGARYTYAEANIGTMLDTFSGNITSYGDSWNSVVGSGRASYQLNEEGSLFLYGGVSQAFRAPNFSDISRLDSARSNELETPSPGLDPEEFVTYEIGVKTNNERLNGGLTYFYTDVNDMILRTPTGRIVGGLTEVIKQNVGDGHIHGVELTSSYKLTDSLTAFGGFAWQDGQITTYPTSAPNLVNESHDRVMPTNGFVGVRWDVVDGQLWVETLVQATAAADRLNTRDIADNQRIPPGGNPEYWLATVRGGWSPLDNVNVTAGVENIFDEEYRAHGSGSNEPGINFVLGLEVKF